MSSDTGSNDDTLESVEEIDYETPFSTPGSTPPLGGSITHDTSRTKYHMKDLDEFATSLENSAKRAFPNRDRSTARYRNVQVLLLRWGDDDLGVAWEVEDLEKTFKSYGFNAETWLIPSENAHLKLMLKAGTFVETHENQDTLFIVYYGGHATINRRRQSTWSCKRDLTYATLEWSAIQIVFEKAKSDVLLLLDCCSAASAAPIAGRAITETIAACGWESIAPEPGRFSFTNTLIKVLREWINRPFTAAMLHCEMLSRLKHENPQLIGTHRVEVRRTPIYIVTTGDLSASSIYLARLEGGSDRPRAKPPPPPARDDVALRATSEEAEGIYKFVKTTVDSALETPHVLISLALEEDQILDAGACGRWLASFPALTKYAKVQGVFKSHSTLLLVSVPVMIWDLLPDNPACSFVGYVSSRNLLQAPSLTQETVDASNASQSRPAIESEKRESSQQRVADINLHEAILDDMAAATLDKEFRAELYEIEKWFRVLPGPERCAALYALLQQTTKAQIEFFCQVLQQMRQASVGLTENSSTSSATLPKTSQPGVDRPTTEAIIPDAIAAIDAEKAQVKREYASWRMRPSEDASTASPVYNNEKNRRPSPILSNALPLLQLPSETYRPGSSHSQDFSPFHSSASGSIYSTFSSDGSRNDQLWPPSRSTSISTATDWPSPLSGSHWSSTGIVNTPQEMLHPPFDFSHEGCYKSSQTTSPTSSRQLLSVPASSGSHHHSPLSLHPANFVKSPNHALGTAPGTHPLDPENMNLIQAQIPDRILIRRIQLFFPRNTWVALHAAFDPGAEYNWISPEIANRLQPSFKNTPPSGDMLTSPTTVTARWAREGSNHSYMTTFRVGATNATYEVLLGRYLMTQLDSQDREFFL